MFDLQATVRWVTGMLKAPVDTAKTYREADPPWMQTLMQLPLPLVVAGAVLAFLVAWLTGGTFGLGMLGIGSVIYMLVSSLLWTFLLAVIIDQLAGFFDGEKNFDRAYGLVGLVVVITTAGTVLGAVAWIGWLLSIAASIYAIYLTYQFVPIFLAVPEENRMKHIIATIVVALVAGMILFGILGSVFGGMLGSSAAFTAPDFGGEEEEQVFEPESSSGGLFGGLERQANIAEEAGNDRYDPPSDGRLEEAQVQRFVRALEKTAALRDRLTKRFENIDDENPSLTDIFGGAGDAMRLGTAEMEVVKTAGGNWAEHQWVRSALETARVQQDINDTVAHNYALFQKYQEQIEALE